MSSPAQPEPHQPQHSHQPAPKPEIYFQSDGNQADDQSNHEPEDQLVNTSQQWEVTYEGGKFQVMRNKESLQKIEREIEVQRRRLEELEGNEAGEKGGEEEEGYQVDYEDGEREQKEVVAQETQGRTKVRQSNKTKTQQSSQHHPHQQNIPIDQPSHQPQPQPPSPSITKSHSLHQPQPQVPENPPSQKAISSNSKQPFQRPQSRDSQRHNNRSHVPIHTKHSVQSELQPANQELLQKCEEMEKKIQELTRKLEVYQSGRHEGKEEGQKEKKEDKEDKEGKEEVMKGQGQSKVEEVTPKAAAIAQKKNINDDRLKKIINAMESVDRGKLVNVEIPKRNKPSRLGPVLSRSFKLSSNLYNIAFGEIMNFGEEKLQDKEQQVVSVSIPSPEPPKQKKTTTSNLATIQPQTIKKSAAATSTLLPAAMTTVTSFNPNPHSTRRFSQQPNFQQSPPKALEYLEQRRSQLQQQLTQIKSQITTLRQDSRIYDKKSQSAADWKHSKIQTEEHLPKEMYWHSYGKKTTATLHLQRSDNVERYNGESENPEALFRKTKHRSRPVSVKRKEVEGRGEGGGEAKKEYLRELRDHNHQENQDKAIQTPQILLAPGFRVTLKDFSFPILPGKPQPYHTGKDLTQLARKTFILLGVPVDQSNILSVRKFKNCVWFKVFDISIVWYYEGKFYIGGWKESGTSNQGEKEGYGIELIPGKYLYEGNFGQGRRHGYGKIRYDNGDFYQGEWVNGVKEGRGKLLEANGVYYEGEMQDGRRDGHGKLIISPLECYEGGFVRGIKNGHGKQSFKTGDSYQGDYVLGKFSGQGRYQWSNGAMYLGQFHNGCRNGKGYWRSSNTTPCDTYDGQYQNDKKCGWGLYTWENGVSYQGEFMNDLRQGEGTVRYPNGKVIRAMWENGSRRQELYCEEKEMYKMARRRAESSGKGRGEQREQQQQQQQQLPRVE